MFAKGSNQIDKESLKASMRELGTAYDLVDLTLFNTISCNLRLSAHYDL